MKDKEKQIEEMKNNARIYIAAVVEKLRMDGCELWEIDGIVENILNYITVPEDSVVLSMGEYERLCSSHDIVFCDNKGCVYNRACSSCEITGCQLNIPEYDKKLKINKHKLDLFEKLCKERERADSWEDMYKLLEEELKQERKETAEKYNDKLVAIIQHLFDIGQIDFKAKIEFLKENEKILKQFGAKIKTTSMEDRCVICGELVPEGRDVCPQCETRILSSDKRNIK